MPRKLDPTTVGGAARGLRAARPKRYAEYLLGVDNVCLEDESQRWEACVTYIAAELGLMKMELTKFYAACGYQNVDLLAKEA